MLAPSDFFDLSVPNIAVFFEGCEYVWNAIANIASNVDRLVGNRQTILGNVMPGAYLSSRPVFIGEGAQIEPGAYVYGPAYIGPNAVVRHGAFVRENVIMLESAVLGHASEAKNSLLLPEAAASHFNYIGDSILGHKTNMGAGSKLSNLSVFSKVDEVTGKRPSIKLTIKNQTYDTGLTKMGAILGDGSQIGCNAVLNPGCVLSPRILVYANVSLGKGYYLPNSIIKLRQMIRRTEKMAIYR